MTDMCTLAAQGTGEQVGQYVQMQQSNRGQKAPDTDGYDREDCTVN